MRIAIVGAGYAGLAAAWHLLQHKHDVTIFYWKQGASYASTGLLHPCPGKKAQPTLRSEEGMAATLKLLKVAGEDTFLGNGILRIAANEEQRKEFGGDTYFIKEGITVFSKKYLDGLRKASVGAHFVEHLVVDLAELEQFDQIVLATGAETLDFVDLPLKKTIGQCLVCRVHEGLPMSLLSHGHITVTEDPEICLVGSTYEHTEEPDPQKALGLLDQVATFYPQAKDFKVIDILSGVRISPKVGCKPILEKIGAKTWVFTALGSRGLIYHALFAEELVTRIGSSINR